MKDQELLERLEDIVILGLHSEDFRVGDRVRECGHSIISYPGKAKAGKVVEARKKPNFIRVLRDGEAEPDPLEYAETCWRREGYPHDWPNREGE